MSLITTNVQSKAERRQQYIMSVMGMQRYTFAFVPVDATTAHKYAGDFHGLLYELRVPVRNHHLVTLANDLKSSGDYLGDKYQVKVIASIE